MVPCQRMKQAHGSALKPKNRSACLCLHLCPIHTRDASVGDSMTYKEKACVCVCVPGSRESLPGHVGHFVWVQSQPAAAPIPPEPEPRARLLPAGPSLRTDRTHSTHSFRAMLPSAYMQIYWHDILKSHWPFSDTRVMCALSRSSLRGAEPWSKHAVFSVWQAAISPAHPAGSSAFVIQRERQRTHQSITESLPSDLGKSLIWLIYRCLSVSSLCSNFSHRPLCVTLGTYSCWHV